jgi:integrase
VFRRSGGWAYRVDAGFHPETGKRRQSLKQGFATKKAAEAALAEALRERTTGTAVARSTIRVEKFLSEWLEAIRSKLRPTTHYSYARAVAKITQHLGRYQLQSLTPLQIERFYAELLASGRRGGGTLSAKSVRNIHVVLRKALADAERLGLVPRNAAAAAKPPASTKREFGTWSSDDLRVFLAGIEGDPLEISFCLLAATGMRRGAQRAASVCCLPSGVPIAVRRSPRSGPR